MKVKDGTENMAWIFISHLHGPLQPILPSKSASLPKNHFAVGPGLDLGPWISPAEALLERHHISRCGEIWGMVRSWCGENKGCTRGAQGAEIKAEAQSSPFANVVFCI